MRGILFGFCIGLICMGAYLIVRKYELAFMVVMFALGHASGWDMRAWLFPHRQRERFGKK